MTDKNPNNTDFHYFKYYDNYRNPNVCMTDRELLQNLEKPFILESFGVYKYENTTYIVIENMNPQELRFILKNCIIEHAIYQKKEEK